MDLNSRSEQFYEFWKKERDRGQLRYVLLNGFIFFVLLTIVTAVLNFRDLQDGDYSQLLDIRRIGMFFVASILVVLFRWRRNERTYQMILKKKEERDATNH